MAPCHPGLAVPLELAALQAVVTMAGIVVTYSLAGLFRFAEMAGPDALIRRNADALDAAGNTAKAVTKGYAIGSAGLGAPLLFEANTENSFA